MREIECIPRFYYKAFDKTKSKKMSREEDSEKQKRCIYSFLKLGRKNADVAKFARSALVVRG